MNVSPPSPDLYVIPTPIGNMEDITLRALTVLKKVDLLLCEDTRRTRKLLSHYSIRSPRLERFDAYTEVSVQPRLLTLLSEGAEAGLVCDAGTPGVCDAAYTLVQAVQAAKMRVCCLPGATALIPALIMSGLPAMPFRFEGFLPRKKGRRARIEQIEQQKSTCVLYESPHRLLKTLREMSDTLGQNGRMSICREISKWYEETLQGTIEEHISHFEAHPPRGEFVLVYRPESR